MKTIYSLKEFRQEVLNLAKLVKKDYVAVYVNLNSNDKIEFQCYVYEHGLHTGETIEECLEKLRQEISPTIKDVDVEIEMPELQTEFDGEPLK